MLLKRIVSLAFFSLTTVSAYAAAPIKSVKAECDLHAFRPYSDPANRDQEFFKKTLKIELSKESNDGITHYDKDDVVEVGGGFEVAYSASYQPKQKLEGTTTQLPEGTTLRVLVRERREVEGQAKPELYVWNESFANSEKAETVNGRLGSARILSSMIQMARVPIFETARFRYIDENPGTWPTDLELLKKGLVPEGTLEEVTMTCIVTALNQ